MRRLNTRQAGSSQLLGRTCTPRAIPWLQLPTAWTAARARLATTYEQKLAAALLQVENEERTFLGLYDMYSKEGEPLHWQRQLTA